MSTWVVTVTAIAGALGMLLKQVRLYLIERDRIRLERFVAEQRFAERRARAVGAVDESARRFVRRP